MRSGTGKGKRLDQLYSSAAKQNFPSARTFPPRKPGAVSHYRLSLLPPCRRHVCAARRRARLSLSCDTRVSRTLCLHRFRLFVLAERYTATNYPVVCFLPPVRGSICSAAPKRLALIWTVHIAEQSNEMFFFLLTLVLLNFGSYVVFS